MMHTFMIIQADSVFNTVGYSLVFSAILVKMGRVYYIFHNPSLAKKVWHTLMHAQYELVF